MELFHKLEQYASSDYYPFHMPGHKRNMFTDMKSPFHYDITEIDGFDNLHDAQDILKKGMEQTAEVFQSLQSYYLVNGSTGGLLSAIFATTSPGDHILMARNCHKSVYNAVMLRNLVPVYLYPKVLAPFQITGSISIEQVEACLKQDANIKVVIITSPSYDGVISNIKAIADIVHKYNKILIVDEAHGAHLLFGSCPEMSAVFAGADLVIQSVHKTLPSLTQTALLHRVTERVKEEEIKQYLSIFQTSSPSYILMSSIEMCVDFIKHSKEEFLIFEERLIKFYNKTKELKHLVVWDPSAEHGVFEKDKSKILICIKNLERSGVWLHQELLENYHIQCEMVSRHYVTCLTSVCDTSEGFERLYQALKDIDDQLVTEQINKNDCQRELVIKNQMVLLPAQTQISKKIRVLLQESVGKVSGEYLYFYPPGIPLIVPGELITQALYEQIVQYQNAGLPISGLSDESSKTIKVIPT